MDAPQHSHLDANDLAAFLSGRLDESHRRGIDQHLDACSECRLLLSLAAAGLGREGLSPKSEPPPRGAP